MTRDSCRSRRSLLTLLQEMTLWQNQCWLWVDCNHRNIRPVKYLSKLIHFRWNNKTWKCLSAFRSKRTSTFKNEMCKTRQLFHIRLFLGVFSMRNQHWFKNGLTQTWRQAISWTNDDKDISANMRLSHSMG